MNWKELLTREMESSYKTAEGLFNLVDSESLDWKPSQENNWMKMGQLLYHVAESCGSNLKRFVTDDWDFGGGDNESEDEEALPIADKFPAAKSVDEAKKLLEEDKELAFSMLNQTTEEDLNSKFVKAPWESKGEPLGYQLLRMIEHLKVHKTQLYYYLKIQGKSVNTMHLWGM